jgi:hypothetical protein
LGDLFYKAARDKVDKECALERDVQQARGGEEEEEDTDFEDSNPGGIYSREHEQEDDSYSFQDSEASYYEDDGEEFGERASGHSPLAMGRYKPDTTFAHDLDWLHKIESRGEFDQENLLTGPVMQTFPCIACNDHKNILEPTTWVPAFLHKASANTWDVFDMDLNQIVHDLEWEGDEGLANLWGLY